MGLSRLDRHVFWRSAVSYGFVSCVLDPLAQIRVSPKLKLQNAARPDFRAGFSYFRPLLSSQTPRPAPRDAHGFFGIPEAGY
jgi:hypothetical protein